MKYKYVAYYSEEGEYETFETFQEAEKWLQEWDQQEGISEETEQGLNYIAKITHVSKVNIVETKKDFEEKGEPWPYDPEWTWMGEVEYVQIEKEGEE